MTEQTGTAEAVVDRQLKAFNQRDADAMANTFAEDGELILTQDAGERVKGREAIRNFYASFFETNPELNAQIENRLRIGNIIADHEYVLPLNMRAIAVYEIEEGLIRRGFLFGPVAGD